MSRFDHLLVISHTAHAKVNGVWLGWGPTTNELNYLATRFRKITHIAPETEFTQLAKSGVSLASNIRLIPVRNRGGQGWRSKCRVLMDVPLFVRRIWPEIKRADLIHVRCPANISSIALLLLCFFPRKPKWIKYAGEWELGAQKSVSYAFQKWLSLHALRNKVITHNGFGQEKGMSDKACFNPSFYLNDLPKEYPSYYKADFSLETVLLFMGHLSRSKGADVFVEMAALLAHNTNITAVLIGPDTAESKSMHQRMSQLLMQTPQNLRYLCTGWLNQNEMKPWLQKAHFVVLPSLGEGWPKVLSEGMAYGCVPISSAVSAVDQVLLMHQTGCTVKIRSAEAFAETIQDYLINPGRWKMESLQAFKSASDFSYERWFDAVPFEFLNK